MKNYVSYKLFWIGFLLISNFLHAQKTNTVEENNLKFQTHFFEGLKQKAIKNYSKALGNLEICYEIDNENTAVEFEFSKNYLLLNAYFEAELFINKALKKEPKNKYLLQHKVVILKKQHAFKDAIEIQKQLIKIHPKHKEELLALYIQNKNFTKARNLIIEIEKNALATNRTTFLKKYLENSKKETIHLPKKINLKSATIESLKKRYGLKKDYAILQEILQRQASDGLFQLLFTDSKNGLELFPAQPYLYKMNGLALNKLGKYTEAISVLTTGIDFVMDNKKLEVAFYEQLSKSYFGLNNKAKALKYKQKAEALRKGM